MIDVEVVKFLAYGTAIFLALETAFHILFGEM